MPTSQDGQEGGKVAVNVNPERGLGSLQTRSARRSDTAGGFPARFMFTDRHLPGLNDTPGALCSDDGNNEAHGHGPDLKVSSACRYEQSTCRFRKSTQDEACRGALRPSRIVTDVYIAKTTRPLHLTRVPGR